MNIELFRYEANPVCTLGNLSIGGVHFCYTLEEPVKDGLPGSAIPAGTYPVIAYPSPKFGRMMPLLQNIPERSEIEMHWGNMVEDTNGCLLLGLLKPVNNFLGESRNAFDAFWGKFAAALAAGEAVTITVNDVPNNADDVREASTAT